MDACAPRHTLPPMADYDLDVTGLSCPLPVLRAKRALKPLAPGKTLHVRATDPAAWRDFEVFCETTGTELVSREKVENGLLHFILRRGS